MRLVASLVLSAIAASCLVSGSYIPPYIEGEPLTMVVTALDPPDIREAPLYRIEITVQDAQGEIIPGMVHRTFAEFKTLDEEVLFGITLKCQLA